MKRVFVALVLLFLTISVVAQSYPFQSVVSQDSDLLTLSQGGVTLVTGQNNPLCPSPNVCDAVTGSYVVGGGNDIVVEGVSPSGVNSSDTQQSTIPDSSQFKGATFSLTAIKSRMRTLVSLTGQTSEMYSFGVNTSTKTSNTVYNSSSIGNPSSTVPSKTNRRVEQEALAQTALSECKANPNGVGFSWEGAADSLSGPFCWAGSCEVRAQINTECWFVSSKTIIDGPGQKAVDYQVDFYLRNAKGETTATGSIANNQSTAILRDGSGNAVAQVAFAGTVGTVNLPLDFGTEKFALSNGTWYVFDSTKLAPYNSAYSQLHVTLSSINNSEGVSRVDGLARTAQRAQQDVKDSFSTRVKNFWNFHYENQKMVFDSGLEYNILVGMVAKAGWLGIVRNVAEFDLTCQDAPTVFTGEVANGKVTIKNLSSVAGSVLLSYSCPGSTVSTTVSVPANSSVERQVVLSGSAGSGTCTVSLKNDSTNKSCGVKYVFQARPEQVLCGNSQVDSGETCLTCPQDVRIVNGPNACSVPPACGNGSVEAGETCQNCPKDLDATNGPGFCAQGGGVDLLIVVGIVLIIAALGWFFLYDGGALAILLGYVGMYLALVPLLGLLPAIVVVAIALGASYFLGLFG